jgi:hypothetical protein
MQTPSTAQIRTAIEVLKKFCEHINHNADNLVIELPDTRLGGHVAARAKVLKIEQTTRIQSVAAQLENWRDQLLQQRMRKVEYIGSRWSYLLLFTQISTSPNSATEFRLRRISDTDRGRLGHR